MKKIKLKKISLLFILLIILIVFISITFLKANNKSLQSIGYSKLEIEEIKKISKNELNTIYKYKYNKYLLSIINNEKYKKDKLNLYLKYTEKYPNCDYISIFELINNDNFKEENVDKYIEYLEKFNDINNIVKYVNKGIGLDDNKISFINEKYFIEDFLDRYLKYYNEHNDLSYKEVVTRINSNLDYTFYEDSNKADLSKGMYTLVNKYYYLDENYVPDDLVDVYGGYAAQSSKLKKVALDNFIKMADEMSKLGMTIKITSGYRSYNLQSSLYNNYVRRDGVNKADTYSARPGYSEHQFGYSFDLTDAKYTSFDHFEYTNEYIWLKDNAYKYGFILRYPKGKEYLTGYQFESWHYRYVGVDIATYIYENDITYEEYYAYFLR